MNDYLTAMRVQELADENADLRRRMADAAEVREGVRERLTEVERQRDQLLAILDVIYNQAWEGMEETTTCHGERIKTHPGHQKFSAICDEAAKAKAACRNR